jgi:hypothetical protein
MFEGKILWRQWARLSVMGWDELRTRGTQEVNKRLDVAFSNFRVGECAVAALGADDATTRFVFTPEELPQIVALLHKRFPNEIKNLIAVADSICLHRFNLLGYHDLDYGEKIDWHLDAVHQRRAPQKPWFKIKETDFGEVGDPKITWELNRHQHLVTLAKAYCLTHEDRFATEAFDQWYHWHQENPYPIGINWASSLEVALRSISWLWMSHLLASCPVMPVRFQSDLRVALGLNARHISRYLSTYSSPNTHLLGEAVGLFYIGVLSPLLPTASRYRQLGWETVVAQANHQVRPDGTHFEQSTYYHVYALDFFLHARTLAIRNKIPIPAAFDRTLEKMLDVLRVLTQAGLAPRLGDDDGGRVFDPRRNRIEHLSDPLATGAVIFERSDLKAAAGGLKEETLWLLGPQGASYYEGMDCIARDVASTQLQAGGIYIMAAAEPVPQQLVIGAGPQGVLTAGHGHADSLSVQLTINGQEWLVDPGTYSYNRSVAQRNYFRGTEAHNTLQVDGLSQTDPAGPFKWRSSPKVQVEVWETGESFDLFAGSHSGYCRLPQPVLHRRWVFGLKSQFWLVLDLAVGEGRHQLELFWHIAPGLLPGTECTDTTVVWKEQTRGLALVAAENSGWSKQILRSQVSPAYGKTEQNSVLQFHAEAHLPIEFAMLLIPTGYAAKQVGHLENMVDGFQSAAVHAYRYVDAQECHHYMFFGDGDRPWSLQSWSSDAHFVYCGIAAGRQHLLLCGGSYLEIDGRRVISCKHLVARFEWINNGATKRVTCSSETEARSLSEDVIACVETILFMSGSRHSRNKARKECAESVE